MRTVLLGDFNAGLERDFAVEVDGRGDVDGDADIEVGELGLDADAGYAGGHAGVVGTGGDGDLLTDFEGGALAVGGADAWVLQDAGVDIGQKCVDGAAGERDSEIIRVEALEVGEGEAARGRGRGGRGGCRSGRLLELRGEADRRRERDAEGADFVAIDLEDRDVDDDLGAGTVEVVDEFFGEQELVCGGAHDDGVLRRDQVELDGGVEQEAEAGEDFVAVVGLGRVREVKGLNGELVEIGALGAGVLRDEDGVGGDRLEESAGDGADDAQGLGKRDVGEIDGDALGGVVGIEDDIEPGLLADGLVDDLDVFDEVQRVGFRRDGFELDGGSDGVDFRLDLVLLRALLEGSDGGGAGELRRWLVALGDFDFLLGGLVGRVDLPGAHELGDGSCVVARLTEDAAAIDVLDGGEEAHALEVCAVAKIGRLFVVGVLVGFVGGVVIFAYFGGLAAAVPTGGGLRVGGGRETGQEEEEGRAGSESLKRMAKCEGKPAAHAGGDLFL